MSEDWHHFERLPLSDPNRTYDYLRSLIDAHLAREDTKSNLAARKSAMDRKRGADGSPAAPGASSTPGTDKKGKGKNGNQKQKEEPKGDSKPGNQGKGKTDQPLDGKCYFFNREHFEKGVGCTKLAKDCRFRHEYMSQQEWDKSKATPPARSPSPAPDRGGKGGGSKSSGKGKGGAITASRCCAEFLKSGRCDKLVQGKDCERLHLSQKDLDRENKSRGAGKDAAREKS